MKTPSIQIGRQLARQGKIAGGMFIAVKSRQALILSDRA